MVDVTGFRFIARAMAGSDNWFEEIPVNFVPFVSRWRVEYER